jgi:DNA-binding transcriptional LysR family regulator
LTHISLVPVAASDHPLTQKNSPLTRSDLRDEVQIVIAQRAAAKSEVTHSVFSSKTWRVADASTKLDLIRAGLGWGFLPLNLVQADLQRGTLTQLALEERSPEPLQAPLSAITLSASPPGPAGRWLLDQMAVICDTCPKAEKG